MTPPKILRKREREVEEPDNHYGSNEDMQEMVPRSSAGVFWTPARIFYTVVVLVLALVVPPAVYYVLWSDYANAPSELWTCNIRPEYRISCPNITAGVEEDECLQIGCCWNDDNKACFHSFPSQHSYKYSEQLDTSEKALKKLTTTGLSLTPRRSKCLYNNLKAPNLQSRVVSISESVLRFYLYDSEIPSPGINDTIQLNSSKFEIKVYGPDYFSLQIFLNDDKKSPILNTSLGPTIACDDYWELALQLPTDAAVFGLGGLRLSSTPKLLYNSGNRLGANPFIMILGSTGRAYGILFKNSGPMEFQLLEISNILSVKSRSRVMWDISLFAGPEPADVMQQYTSIDGLRPALPPAWALGVHICRDTERYNSTLAADDAKYFLGNATNMKLPYESDCLQEGLLYRMDFDISTDIGDVIKEFNYTGRKLLLSLPPHVISSLAEDETLFVSNGSVRLQEEFYGLNVSYPDFIKEKTKVWYTSHINDLEAETGDIFGGFVLQDNWPASNTTQDPSQDMDVVEGKLSTGTLWWQARQGNSSVFHHEVHNEYGLRHAEVVASAMKEKNTLVLSAATHTGIGAVGGSHAHAQANVRCLWGNMKTALQTALGLGLAGIPLAGGGSVCGTTGDYDEELCMRWYLMSSMLPVMRVSSEDPLRDPANLPAKYSLKTVKIALELRYSLLAYFYSLFHEASNTGVPVARPMFFDFPSDNKTWTLDEQFMIGPALMARPAFYQDAVTVSVYFPKEDTSTPWYHFNGGNKVYNGAAVSPAIVPSLKNELVLLLRGGFIVPYQKPEITVDKTLAGPYNLVVGLRCIKDGNCSAKGSLYRESENLTFTANATVLTFSGSCSKRTLQSVSVYGLPASTKSCTVVNSDASVTCKVKEEDGAIEINNLQRDLCNATGDKIEWKIST